MFNRLAREEKGLALPLVMILILVVSLLGISALFLVESQTTMGSQYTGSVQTIHYAEAGIHKYLWYLNKEGATQPLFDTDIPFEDGFFRLSLVAQEEGYQVIRSTGWRSDRESTRRTIEAVLTKRTFCRQVYLSENDGTNIWWVDGEKCYGPYHTNSSLRVKGRPVFYGKVTYVNSIVPYDYNTNPDFREGTEQVTPLQFPSSNNQLKLLAGSAGHLYEGRTSIYLKGDKYDVHYYDSQAKSFIKETEKEFPPNGVIYVNGGSSSQKFNSKSGNAFVSGTLQGRLTIAAANNIYITGRDPTE
ncbi:MAG TPA: hypothetical protein GX711_04900, partial [Clostridia bacterium]|nr:hypothetical protein [Clostridia bacterium]